RRAGSGTPVAGIAILRADDQLPQLVEPRLVHAGRQYGAGTAHVVPARQVHQAVVDVVGIRADLVLVIRPQTVRRGDVVALAHEPRIRALQEVPDVRSGYAAVKLTVERIVQD